MLADARLVSGAAASVVCLQCPCLSSPHKPGSAALATKGSSMVSVIAKNIRNRRQHRGGSQAEHFGSESISVVLLHNYLSSALCELFDKADTSGDGTISLEEYMVICDE